MTHQTTEPSSERAELIFKLKRRAMASTNPDLSAELMQAAALLSSDATAGATTCPPCTHNCNQGRNCPNR